MFLDASHELLRAGYSVRFCAGGRSMFPTIHDGEMITVEPVAPADVKRNDIILYRFQNRLRQGVMAHRVIGIERTAGALQFILRGDGMAQCDAPIAETDILGRVIAVERDGRLIPLATRRAKLTRKARVAAATLKKKLARA
jgi:signal peptidase I